MRPAVDIPAPPFPAGLTWVNVASLRMDKQRGRPVLVEFLDVSAPSSLRSLPYLQAWHARYADAGLRVVSVHTPGFASGRDPDAVRAALTRLGVEHPVVLDPDFQVWDLYGTEGWPSRYLFGADQRLAEAHFGEGGYAEKEQVIRELLKEAGRRPGGALAGAHGEGASPGVTTPETYLGAARAERFANGPIRPGTQEYSQPRELRADQLGYGGRWKVGQEAATALADARLELDFGARHVYLVLGSRGGVPRSVHVMLDGRPIAARVAGRDVHAGRASVERQRLYELVDLPRAERHRLTLDLDPGVSGYAFTFG